MMFQGKVFFSVLPWSNRTNFSNCM